MKYKDIVELNKSLKAVEQLKGVKFAYAVAKNTKIIEPEIDSLKEAAKSSEKFTSYQQDFKELQMEHAEKNEKGDLVIKDEKAFTKALEKLQEEHREAIDGRKKQSDEIEKLLEEEVELKLLKVKKEELPEDITAEQLKGIMEIVE